MRRAAIFILSSLFLAACGPAKLPGREAFRGRSDGWSTGDDGNAGRQLRIIVMDVGQGDAALVIAPTGEAILVDAGPPGAGRGTVLPLLKEEGIEGLDAIVATHYHEDHIAGIPEVIAGEDGEMGTPDDIVPDGGVYDRGTPELAPEAPSFPLYEAAAAGRRHGAYPGMRIGLGDVDVEVVAAGGKLPDGTEVDLGEPPDENAASVALVIGYAGFRMFLGGDITGGGGNDPYQTPDVETPLGGIVGEIAVLKVSHHGSLTSTNAAFLAATSPEAAIISVGDGNDYFQPHRQVIERLAAAGATVYQTERGWLSLPGPFVTDGDVEIAVEEDGSYTVK